MKKLFTSRFTFMVIPHRSGRPLQINVPFSVVLVSLFIWTGVTFWGSYLSAQHIDYWKAEMSNQMLKLKVSFLVKQLDKSRGYMDEVKEIESQLRDLLQYKNRRSIITEEKPVSDEGTGGPSVGDEKDLTQALNNHPMVYSWERLMEKVQLFKNEAEHRIASHDDLARWIDQQRDLYRKTPRGWPCPGHLTSSFGMRIDPFSKLPEFHYGIDISGPTGTPVRATADGTVKMASWHSGYGKLVVLDHGFGYSTRYAHNGRLLVKVGDKIRRGQPIALMGNTGKSSGPHCHYEVWRYSKRVNPYAYLKSEYPKSTSLSKNTKPPKRSSSQS